MLETNRRIDRGVILAALIVAAYDKEPTPDNIEIQDLSKMLAELVKKDVVDLSDFSFSPGGRYSEDVARFVGNYLLSGDAISRSPVKFQSSGIKNCAEMVIKASHNQDMVSELSKIATVFGINLEKIKEKYI